MTPTDLSIIRLDRTAQRTLRPGRIPTDRGSRGPRLAHGPAVPIASFTRAEALVTDEDCCSSSVQLSRGGASAVVQSSFWLKLN